MINPNDTTNSSMMNSDKNTEIQKETQRTATISENSSKTNATTENSSEKPHESINSDPVVNKSKRWSFIQSDLEKALDTWQELEKTQAKLSPEEEQFQKIKTIIGQLKSKIEQF